jgi:hypothetical protein
MGIIIPLLQGLSLKIDDTPPGRKDYPTARLQKGFLLQDQGQELAEEAVGFGVPVLKRGLQTIFPGSVALTCQRRGSMWEITALFKLNLVEKISRGGNENVEDRLVYAVKNLLAVAIRRLHLFRGVLTSISSTLRQVFNWETTYADAGFSTEAKILFTIEEKTGKIIAEIDTGSLPPDITEVIVMNELGAHFFDRYLDTSGISLKEQEISCWDGVNAEEAWFESSAYQIAFRLRQAKGARLFRGRELIGSRLAWAGFGYSFLSTLKRMQYEMRIEKLA